MKTNPSIQLRRQGPPTEILCTVPTCRAVVTTLAAGERVATTRGAGAEVRSGTCGCGRAWRVAVIQEAAHGG